ncbi:MAG: lycopene beta-cyclase CrtY [Bacteroidia bacterium]|nr:lycopene beta-cyclase CrtY [Bacteroidia bacterium]
MYSHYGCIFIGGGLSSILAAYTWLELGYSKPILIIEQNSYLCGNHTWSFNQTDILPQAWNLLQPLIDVSWQSYQVKFPKIERTVLIPYHTIFSQSLSKKIKDYAEKNSLLQIITGQRASVLRQDTSTIVVTQNNHSYTADWIFYATGNIATFTTTAYQKFVGLEVILAEPVSLPSPIIMDATVAQKDGFRFMYVLPFEPKRLLIEDTYYSLNQRLNVSTITDEIQEYAQNKGWKIVCIQRQEQGVLPIPLSQEKPACIHSNVLPLGMHANLFHVTTGYSLAANYNFIWQMYPFLEEKNLPAIWYQKLLEFHRSMQFYRIMNRFLFIAGKTDKRYRFLEAFYQRCNDAQIARFYAGKSTFQDKMHILSGKAPFRPSWYMLNALIGIRREID